MRSSATFGEQRNQRTTAVLSKATMHSTLGGLKAFFHWLAGQPGYKSRLRYSDAEYFNLSEKDVRVATARRNQLGPTLEQLGTSSMGCQQTQQLNDETGHLSRSPH